MFAGGAVGIQAVGAGRDSSLSVQGSDIKGGADVVLKAEGDLRLLGAANTSELHRQSSSKSGAIGVVASVNSQGGTLGITANASAARGMAEGSDLSWSNTHVSAGNTLHLESGQDTLLKGAVVSAPQISARVGGDLKLESLQDTSTYRSKDQSIGGSVTVGYGSASGSVSVSQQKIHSDFASVREQSGMQAGARGFQVEVGGTTALKGAVIASSDAAVNGGQNTFSTGGPLTLEDVRNQANYQGSAYGVSLGVGTGQDGKLKGSGSGVGFGQMSGNASSTTTAGISGLAGDVGVRTGDKSQGLSTIFDATRVSKDLSAQVAITKQFGQEAPKAIATYADTQIKTLSSQLSEAPDDQKAAIQSELSKWAEGGSYRVALHTLSGALAGGMAGALGAQVAAEAAPTLNKLQDHITDTLITQGLNETAARIAGQFIAQGTATGMGAVASGGNLAGAGMAFDVDANNRALHDTEKQRIKALARDFAKQLNGGKTPTQGEIDEANDRLTAAACALVSCSAEYARGSSKYLEAQRQQNSSQGDGAAFAILNQAHQRDSSFLEYGFKDKLADAGTRAINEVSASVRVARQAIKSQALNEALVTPLQKDEKQFRSQVQSNEVLGPLYGAMVLGVSGVAALPPLLADVSNNLSPISLIAQWGTGKPVGCYTEICDAIKSNGLLATAESIGQSFARLPAQGFDQFANRQFAEGTISWGTMLIALDGGVRVAAAGFGKAVSVLETGAQEAKVIEAGASSARRIAEEELSLPSRNLSETVAPKSGNAVVGGKSISPALTEVSQTPESANQVTIACAGTACFVAGTLVTTASGPKAIETFQGGELVLSRDEASQTLGYRPVTATKATPDQALIEVVVRHPGGQEETLHTTAEHPFWVSNLADGAYWRRAADLVPGMALVSAQGEALAVVAQTPLTERATVFNIQVDEHHTYHIGVLGVWVHNADCCGVGRATPEGSNGAKTPPASEGAATELSQQSGKVDSGKGVNSANATVISAEMEEKILFGQRAINSDGNATNRLIGAHSGEISNANPSFAVETLSVNADGTRNVKLLTQFDDGNVSRIKTSTLFPESWTNEQVINAIKQTGGMSPVATRASDGAALYQSTVNGVKVEVIKIGDRVTAGYPCGKGCTNPANF